MEKNNFIIAYLDFSVKRNPAVLVADAVSESGALWRCMQEAGLVPITKLGGLGAEILIVDDPMAESIDAASERAAVLKAFLSKNPETTLSGKPAPIPRDHGAICLSDSIGHLPIETPDRDKTEQHTLLGSGPVRSYGYEQKIPEGKVLKKTYIGGGVAYFSGCPATQITREGDVSDRFCDLGCVREEIIDQMEWPSKPKDPFFEAVKKTVTPDIIENNAFAAHAVHAAKKFSEKETKPKRIGRPPAESLTTDQRVILRKICDRNDLGKPVSAAELSDITGIASMDYKIKGMEERGYILKHKEGLRKVTLIPLKRVDGSEYTAPIKENGITKLPAAPGLINLDALEGAK